MRPMELRVDMSSTQGESGTAAGLPARLYRDVLDGLQHDLGGVTAALALRADVLDGTRVEADRTALRAMSEELRSMTRLLRLIRGDSAPGLLSPSQTLSTLQWWELVHRVTTYVLPRGVTVRPSVMPGELPFQRGHVLAVLWLAACRGVNAQGVAAPATLELTVPASTGPADAIDLSAVLTSELPRARRRSTQPWRAFSNRFASQHGLRLSWWSDSDGALVWTCCATRPAQDSPSEN
jgi:hypothetical protein